ncbi:hypothetical protein BpHYR1_004514 [Brachionus plicatilis]|uniref:Uncharacterized protein n=1 Tax=Brachionus plicatilis TaxID=10195 RepID=A0A3M7SIQ2_BRAPC|nr:hypothetical protein BpHYR1_004514 [Brachionus plicatilis]
MSFIKIIRNLKLSNASLNFCTNSEYNPYKLSDLKGTGHLQTYGPKDRDKNHALLKSKRLRSATFLFAINFNINGEFWLIFKNFIFKTKSCIIL